LQTLATVQNLPPFLYAPLGIPSKSVHVTTRLTKDINAGTLLVIIY